MNRFELSMTQVMASAASAIVISRPQGDLSIRATFAAADSCSLMPPDRVSNVTQTQRLSCALSSMPRIWARVGRLALPREYTGARHMCLPRLPTVDPTRANVAPGRPVSLRSAAMPIAWAKGSTRPADSALDESSSSINGRLSGHGEPQCTAPLTLWGPSSLRTFVRASSVWIESDRESGIIRSPSTSCNAVPKAPDAPETRTKPFSGIARVECASDRGRTASAGIGLDPLE